MKFKEAFEKMKSGAKVKLPGWRGYWYWDSEKETIMMRCRQKDSDQGDLLEEWEIADEKNCPVLGGTATFSFADAIRYLKRGLKVARQGWNGKSQYIEIATNISYVNASGQIVNCEHDAIGNKAIAFVGTSGVQMGWLASQADMLADDWVFAE